MKRNNAKRNGWISARAAKAVFYFLGVMVVFGGMMIPMSATHARSALGRQTISVSIGIGRYIGLEVSDNSPGSGVAYSNGVYSKTMTMSESLGDFGTTTFKVICNFDTNLDTSYQNGYNCKDNGWGVTAEPSDTVTEQGTAYAAMVSSESSSILSKENALTSQNSNWAMQVAAISRSVEGVGVSPTVADGYSSAHTIPATSTEIVSGKNWVSTKDPETQETVYYYVDGLEFSTQYGVSISSSQASGTYSGSVEYTLALKASS